MTTAVTVALDWTPNVNHTGFYVAIAKGYYQEAGLSVTLLSPHVDAYKSTPASHLLDGTAHFAVTPSETVVSFHSSPDASRPKLVALAALLADSTSAVVTLASSGISRPKELDGKTYASYGARYEGRIVQQMIKNDGGTGVYTESTPPMLGIWNTLLKGEADATWVFLGWEGIEAKRKGVALNVFKLEDYGVQYGYSPLLVTHPDTVRDKRDLVSSFMAATSKGFIWAAANPTEAAAMLVTTASQHHSALPLPEPLDADIVQEAQAYTSQHYIGSGGRWGEMTPLVWDAFLDWLHSQGLLTSKMQSRTPVEGVSTTLDGLREGDVGQIVARDSLQSASMYTNDFLPKSSNS